jgi:MarR family transcriptional regulator, organic hydroperoxide resistance regulator
VTGSDDEFKAMHDDFEGVDELSSGVFRAFLTTLRLHRQLMVRTFAERGTHPGQAMCLRLLAARDGITQRDLAASLHLSPPTITRMLQAMEKAELIERRPHDSDQRLTCVGLTAAGRDLEQELRAVAAGHVNETIGTLSEDDRRELGRLLDELSASIVAAIDARPDAADGGGGRATSGCGDRAS